MSQYVTVIFPKFHFDVEKDYELQFENGTDLPFFTVRIGDRVFVETVMEGHVHSSAIQPGLAIVSINGKDITDSLHNGATFKQLASEHTPCTITFREELEDDEQSNYTPLGLQYPSVSADHDEGDEHKEKQNPELETDLVADKDIIATSSEPGHESYHARLNNPNSYWKPTRNELSFLQIDLQSTKQITMLKIQGNHDHTACCKSLWIDYSRNGCQWKSVNYRHEMQCNYNEEGIATIHIWPSLETRFVRIRPQEWHNFVAVRMELYGFHTVNNADTLNARVVTLNDVDGEHKQALLERVLNLSVDTKVIQVNCRQIIRTALDRAGITNCSFIQCQNPEIMICTFSTDDTEQSERALDALTAIGVGKEIGIVNAMNIDYRQGSFTLHQNQSEKRAKTSSFNMEKYERKQSKPFSFANSVKSRKLVHDIIDRVMNSAIMTFDYLMMLLAASCIAAAGLATANSVIVVAAMLVSPLMGPVLALTFGVMLNEWKMAKIGLKNELISVAICILVGLVFGIIYPLISENARDWPTKQMVSRGEIGGIADGAFIAAVSGIGVALSVVGDYTSTLIGVAISASLLPPAVNCGMLFSFALYENLFPENVSTRYSRSDLMEMGAWSLVLTIENIVIIFAVSLAIFQLKQVARLQGNRSPVWKSVTNFKHKMRAVVAKNPLLVRDADSMPMKKRTNVIFKSVDTNELESISFKTDLLVSRLLSRLPMSMSAKSAVNIPEGQSDIKLNLGDIQEEEQEPVKMEMQHSDQDSDRSDGSRDTDRNAQKGRVGVNQLFSQQ